MNRVIEFLGGRRGREVSPPKKMSDISPIIEPATGEKKTEIERECAEYLQDPKRDSAPDFLEFTHNMIELIGGKRSQNEGQTVEYTSSDPLLDQKANSSIVLKTNISDGMSILKIRAEFADKLEELQVIFPVFNKGGSKEKDSLNSVFTDYSMFVDFSKPQFDSYIKGTPITSAIYDLGLNEVKGFGRRIFDVHKRQQTQPSTPQN